MSEAETLARQAHELLADQERAARTLQRLNAGLAELRGAERARARVLEIDAIVQAQTRAEEASGSVLRAVLSRPQAPGGWLARRKRKRALARRAAQLNVSHAFSAAFYREAYPDIAAAGIDPALHFVRDGWRELRQPHPLFETGWYLRSYPDVVSAGIDPLTHFLRGGSREGRRPNRVFDGNWYRHTYADVAAAGMDPFLHYLAHGAAEGRWPHPLFNPQWYAETYGTAGPDPWGALLHYLAIGHRAGNKPNPFFDPAWYAGANPDLRAAPIDLLDHYHRVGGREGRAPSRAFDAAAYLATHADVAAAGVEPLAHYLQHGRLEGRIAVPANQREARPAGPGRVVYVGLQAGNPSHPYRVQHKVEVLRAAGFDASWIELGDLARDTSLVRGADVVVFARTEYEPAAAALAFCREAGIVVAYDVDDYVFDPAVANSVMVDGLRELPIELHHAYYHGVLAYRQMVLAADIVLVTTEMLRQAVQAFGRPAALLPNGARAETVTASDLARDARTPRTADGPVVVGFASGTKTHQRDFALVAPALARLMSERPSVRLQVVGALDLAEFPELARFADRVTRRPLVTPDRLPAEYAAFDINLAPLEIGNPYCEAKSTLKHLEAALAGVPTIASATEPFRAAMVDGVTGFLATTQADWEAALFRLVDEPGLAKAVADAARTEALTIGRRRHDALATELFTELVLARRSRVAGLRPDILTSRDRQVAPTVASRTRLRIGWVIPGLIIGGGGHRNILRAAHHLQSFGHEVTLYFRWTEDSAETLHDLVRRHFYPFAGRVLRIEDAVPGSDDVVFATHYSTVDPAIALTGPRAETFYFVQDFEPAFAAMGSDYIRAENTYRQGLYAITSGPWCARILRRTYGMEADSFRFPVDRDIYHPRPAIRRRDRIVFFAKPEMGRRCFEIGADALGYVHALRPDVEIVFFGSREAGGRVDYPVTTLDVLPGIGDLADLYAGARLGLVFSTTNPSLVPYEMMACGLPIVDLDRADNDANYDDRRDIAFLADPNPRIMAEQIVRLLEDDDELAARSRKGLAFAAGFPSELEMAKRVEELILARLASRPRVVAA